MIKRHFFDLIADDGAYCDCMGIQVNVFSVTANMLDTGHDHSQRTLAVGNGYDSAQRLSSKTMKGVVVLGAYDRNLYFAAFHHFSDAAAHKFVRPDSGIACPNNDDTDR